MNVSVLLFQFAPLFAYIVVDYLKGFKAGICAAIISSAVALGYDYYRTGEVESFMLGESLLIVGLGLLSLRMNNDRYFKFQPTVVAWIFTLMFAYFQLFEKPLLLHFLPHMEKLFSSEVAGSEAAKLPQEESGLAQEMLQKLHDPSTQEFFGLVSFGSIWLFFAHGLIMAYAALRLSTRAWFGWRLAIYPAFLFMVIYYQLRIQAP